MGLSNYKDNFVEIQIKLVAIRGNIFSLYFAQLGGILTLGEIDNKTFWEKNVFLPTKKVRGRDFNINMKSILFYDKKFENNDFYIKSGINLSSFDRIIFNEILN